MKYTIKENQLNYETYYTLRKSVGWNNWSKEQAEKALENSYYSIVIFYFIIFIFISEELSNSYSCKFFEHFI